MSKYSIVVPAYNEEATLRLFYQATVPAFETLNEEFEIIFVNDGSTDTTQEILAELAKADKRIKVCRFSRNFGRISASWIWAYKPSREPYLTSSSVAVLGPTPGTPGILSE